MEGYRFTPRGKVVLALLLIALAYGLFILGTHMGDGIRGVLNTQPATTAAEVPQVTSDQSTTEQTPPTSVTEQPTTEVAPIEETTSTPEQETTQARPDASELVKFATIVYFKPDQYRLDSDAVRALSEFIDAANQYPDLPIIIEGYAGSIGINDDSEKLALKRAETIKAYLMSTGINGTRIHLTSQIGATKDTAEQQLIWKSLRAEIYFQGYAKEK